MFTFFLGDSIIETLSNYMFGYLLRIFLKCMGVRIKHDDKIRVDLL